MRSFKALKVSFMARRIFLVFLPNLIAFFTFGQEKKSNFEKRLKKMQVTPAAGKGKPEAVIVNSGNIDFESAKHNVTLHIRGLPSIAV